jgi:MYXO-CTERM domain-containing protein
MKKFLIGLAIAASAPAFAASGLAGTYYNPSADTTGWWDDFNSASSYLASNPTPTGSFLATTLNYGGGDLSSIVSFLGADGASYHGADGNLNDGVLVLKGWIDLGAGSTSLTVSHDDGFRLVLDGATVAQSGCCGNTSVDVDYASAGWHAIEIDYNNASYGQVGGATFAFSVNNEPVDAATLSSVPETQNAALLLAGLGLLGITARRRRTH